MNDSSKCAFCANDYQPENYNQKFCCYECARLSRVSRRRKSPAIPPTVRKCLDCGGEFTIGAGQGLKLYCTSACRIKASRPKREPRDCAICKQPFTPVSSLARFCSDKCRMDNAERLSLRSDHFRRIRDIGYGYGDE